MKRIGREPQTWKKQWGAILGLELSPAHTELKPDPGTLPEAQPMHPAASMPCSSGPRGPMSTSLSALLQIWSSEKNDPKERTEEPSTDAAPRRGGLAQGSDKARKAFAHFFTPLLNNYLSGTYDVSTLE